MQCTYILRFIYCIYYSYLFILGFSGGSVVKQEGSGKSIQKEMATHSNILSWKIPRTEEPGGLYPCGCRVWHALMTAVAAAAAAKSLQSCPTLCDPIEGSPPGSPVSGILQARTLEWVAISFSNAWKWKVKVKLLSRVRLPATPWTAAHQALPSMGLSRQEYWSGVPLPLQP